MKIGMVLVLLAVLVTAYLIGSAIRKRNQRVQKHREEQARLDATWTVFTDPDGPEILVGVQKVARAGRYCEVLDSEVLTRVDATQPEFDRDTEVRIAKANAKAYADILND